MTVTTVDQAPLAQGVRTGRVRLVVGITLILVSVLGVVAVVQGAQRTEGVYVAARNLPAGTVLTPKDLQVIGVRLATARQGYLEAGASVSGTTDRPIARGELIPRSAIRIGAVSATRLVTLPVEQFHAPSGLTVGDVVDVYATPTDAMANANATVIAQSVVVRQVDTDGGRFGSASGATGVVVEVSVKQAARIVAGVRTGSVDLVPVVWGKA